VVRLDKAPINWKRTCYRRLAVGLAGGIGQPEAEAVRGYYRERDKLIDTWDAHERNRDPKK
jgi:hypothetical protein